MPLASDLRLDRLGGIPADAFVIPGVLAYAVVMATFANIATDLAVTLLIAGLADAVTVRAGAVPGLLLAPAVGLDVGVALGARALRAELRRD
jgi:hypothetical protein